MALEQATARGSGSHETLFTDFQKPVPLRRILGTRVSDLERKLKTLEVGGLWNLHDSGKCLCLITVGKIAICTPVVTPLALWACHWSMQPQCCSEIADKWERWRRVGIRALKSLFCLYATKRGECGVFCSACFLH